MTNWGYIHVIYLFYQEDDPQVLYDLISNGVQQLLINETARTAYSYYLVINKYFTNLIH